MEMISIQKFLKPGTPTAGDYIRLLRMTLDAISLHAEQTSKSDDLTQFRKEVATVSRQLNEQSSLAEVEQVVDFVIRAATGYDRIAARTADAHLQELQAMLAMMAETITYLSDSGRTGINQLRLVEDTIRKASNIDDIRVLRGKLDDCLTLVRNESNRLRAESRTRIAILQQGFERTAGRVKLAGMDLPATVLPKLTRETPPEIPLTGLRGRESAEEMIAANVAQSKQCAVAVFVINRFGNIKGRFGSTTGDHVLLAVAQHLRERLATHALFQWSGPAFAAIVESDDAFHVIERKMANIASVRLENALENQGRGTVIAVTCSVIVQKISDADSLADIVAHLDDFVATRA